MSLTTFLELRQVKERFRKEFPKPLCPRRVPMIVPPSTKKNSLVGTAFDYLVRWYVKKLNPKAIDSPWVAEDSPGFLSLIGGKAARQKGQRILREARKAYRRYLATEGQGKPGSNLIAHAARLARLDVVVRAGLFDGHTFGEVEADVVKELNALLNAATPEKFLARKICVLNPTFGEASILVGGADADLLIDGTLIEIKTIKQMRLDRRIFNQLVGYYVLSRIGGIDGCSHRYCITSRAVYYSRQGLFVPTPLEQVIDESKLATFISWFERTARKANADSG